MRTNPDQLELPFEEITPKSTVKDMLRRKPSSQVGYFMKTDKRVDHETVGGCQVDTQNISQINSIVGPEFNCTYNPLTKHIQVRDVAMLDFLIDGHKVGELPEVVGEPYYEVSIKLNEFEMRKLDELATYHHLDKEKALKKVLEEYEVSAPMPKSQTCRDVKREAGRTREKPEEWKVKEVMRRQTNCKQESDRTYVGNKSCRVFPGKDGRKKARRWLAEKIVIEEGL